MEVSRGQQRAPKSAAIAARNVARPVEATRKQLFHAVHELRQIVAKRKRELQVAKEQFLEAKRVRREQKREAHEANLKSEFARTTERLSEARERGMMNRADMETREYIRNLRTQEEDMRIRRKLKCQRREQEESALMLVEEYQIRYFVAESQRRELEAHERLQEVSKREEFLQKRAQQQLREMEILMRANSEKQVKMERQRLLAHEKEKARWASLSKAEQAEAAERLRRREWEEEEARQRLEDEQDVERAKARVLERQKEALRQQKYDELEREFQERGMMEEADKFSRRWHFYQKKTVAAEQWAAKREKERTRYSLDPMQFAKIEAQKSLEERQRRENYLMRNEDVLSAAIEEKERKEKYFQLCREKKRLRDIERRRETNEMLLMGIEDEHEQERRRMIDQAEEYKRTLLEMQQLADQVASKQKDRLQEARNRKLMYDEENRQHRLEQTQLLLDGICEKRERQNMEEEDRKAQHLDIFEARQEEKRIRKKRNLRMMREDVATMERQNWEDEAACWKLFTVWGTLDKKMLQHLLHTKTCHQPY
ncbi:hypothetical protein BBJ29_001905 [Phytophthora kernoviae]|uniref:Trichohyalin-plectin-homology domain-containing protein n=1 Tax=Phytophthora kernoviae TaxID=325452 RepID=A0A3F2S0Z3_9STRA|nr:hypothetical protein BBJ29_001905 [Phytophthora kernoviae]RLN68192.1 hypothetical protein BBP00_00001130 [Phytophthora kernoviae]